MPLFKGSGVALITPFNEHGVNYDALGTLIDFQLENKTDALIVAGTTGEPSTMSTEEKEGVIDFAVRRVHGRIPVIAGTGGNDTAAVIRASVRAQKLGADGLLVVTPYYNKATQKGLIAHYNAVADSVCIPIIVYNVPGRTGVNLLPDTMRALSEHPRLRTIKEACGSVTQISELIRQTEGTVDVISGDDNLILPLLSLGATGVISVLANIAPLQTHELCAAWFSGDMEKARRMQLDMLPLCAALFAEVSPGPVKAAARMMGLPVGHPRLPIVDPEAATRTRLAQAMRAYGLPVKEENA